MTPSTRFDVTAIGNALVDVLSHEHDDFVVAHGLRRGAMVMADAETSQALYEAMGPGTEMSGGSAANTVAGIASLGGTCAFVGKVADDQLGKVFTHDMRSLGVHFDTPPAPSADPATGRCLVIVTSDAQRTMSTYLGAADQLGPDDVDEATIAASDVVFVEGYLWDQPHAKDAIRRASELAHRHGRRVAFTLSDPFCVERHREEFLHLAEHEVDVLFANEVEIMSLYQVDTFDAALQNVRGHCEVAGLTRSEHGSVVVAGDDVHVIDPHPVEQVVDTTGAGDLYAAGFLYGLTHGHDLATCGRLGSMAAAEVISHIGARPAVSLAELAAPILG